MFDSMIGEAIIGFIRWISIGLGFLVAIVLAIVGLIDLLSHNGDAVLGVICFTVSAIIALSLYILTSRRHKK